MASRHVANRVYGKNYQYGNWELSAAEKANLPPNIKCRRCAKVKPARFFSNNQLKELGTHIGNHERIKGKSYDATTAMHICCETCSGKPAVELECYRCGVWKVLDAFTKVQRRNGDEAKCQKCMEEIKSLEPTDYDEPYGSSGDDDGDDDDSDGSDGLGLGAGTVYNSTTNSMRDMSITGGSSSIIASQSGGVSLAAGSSQAGHSNFDDEYSDTSSISVITTKQTWGGGRNSVRKPGNEDGPTSFAKVHAVLPHKIGAKDFQERRKRELAAQAKSRAEKNGAEPDDLDDVAVESSEDEDDDDELN